MERPIVAVLGSFRGGTSCVAGTMHALGISMGRGMRGPARANPKGFFEGPALARICRAAIHEPKLIQQLPDSEIVDRLAQWFANRQQQTDSMIGAKHPLLCMMVPHMLTAWPGVRFVRVIRPASESSRSLSRLRWFPPERCRNVPAELVAARDAALESKSAVKCTDLNFADLLSEPATQVDRLIASIGIRPTAAQRAAAIAFPQRELATA